MPICTVSYEDRLKRLKIYSLERRRQRFMILFMYIIIIGLVPDRGVRLNTVQEQKQEYSQLTVAQLLHRWKHRVYAVRKNMEKSGNNEKKCWSQGKVRKIHFQPVWGAWIFKFRERQELFCKRTPSLQEASTRVAWSWKHFSFCISWPIQNKTRPVPLQMEQQQVQRTSEFL